MINWNTDEERLKREHPKEYQKWRVVQLINHGSEGEKLDPKFVKKIWSQIKDRISPDKQKVIEFFLWNKPWRREKGLLPDRSNFWTWFWEKNISSTTSTSPAAQP